MAHAQRAGAEKSPRAKGCLCVIPGSEAQRKKSNLVPRNIQRLSHVLHCNNYEDVYTIIILFVFLCRHVTSRELELE